MLNEIDLKELPSLIRPKQASELIGCSISTVYVYLTEGHRLRSGEVVILPGMRVGGKRFIATADLAQFIARISEGWNLSKSADVRPDLPNAAGIESDREGLPVR
jgi:hypothetical protein